MTGVLAVVLLCAAVDAVGHGRGEHAGCCNTWGLANECKLPQVPAFYAEPHHDIPRRTGDCA